MVWVPEDESLDIDQRFVGCSLRYQCVIVASCERTAVRRSLPVMIDLRVKRMHAACRVGGVTVRVPRGKDVECAVRLWTIGIWRTAVYPLESTVPILLGAKTSLYTIDLDERGDHLSVGVSKGARGSW
jgi:hypothetical protein